MKIHRRKLTLSTLQPEFQSSLGETVVLILDLQVTKDSEISQVKFHKCRLLHVIVLRNQDSASDSFSPSLV